MDKYIKESMKILFNNYITLAPRINTANNTIFGLNILRECLVEYYINFNLCKLALGAIIFRILLILLWLTLFYLFDICNFTYIEPIYLVWTFIGLLIFNSIYKSYKVSRDKAILCFVTLVLNSLVIFITLTAVFYLIYWLDIWVNDNPTWKLYLLGFSLDYALCMDPLSEYLSDLQGSVGEGVKHNCTLFWVLGGFSLNYELSVRPAIHLADYYDCQTENQGSLGEGGGPQIPQGLTPFDQSSDSNLEQENDKVYSPYPQGEDGSPSISTTEDTNFWSKSLKNFLSNLFGLELFKTIIDSKIHDTKVVNDWHPIHLSPTEVTNQLTCNKDVYSVLACKFNLEGNVSYTWVKDLNLNKHFLFKFYTNSSEKLVFEVITKDCRTSINLGSGNIPLSKYAGSSYNAADESSSSLVPQTQNTSSIMAPSSGTSLVSQTHYTSSTTVLSSGTYLAQMNENPYQFSSSSVMVGSSSSQSEIGFSSQAQGQVAGHDVSSSSQPQAGSSDNRPLPFTTHSEMHRALNPTTGDHIPFTLSPYFYRTISNEFKPYFWGQYHNENLQLYEKKFVRDYCYVKTIDANPMLDTKYYYIRRDNGKYSLYRPGSHLYQNTELYFLGPYTRFYEKTGIITPKDCPVFINNRIKSRLR